MKNDGSKKRTGKRARVLLLTLACLAAAALLWAFAVEPILLTVSEVEYADARLPKELDGTRIVFFSDIHIGTFYSERDAERVTETIAELKPDMLLFGGDLLQHSEDAARVDGARVARAFAAIRPKLGKYAVLGNHDIRTPEMKRIATAILTVGGFSVLENSAAEAAPGFFVAGTAPWPMEGENGPGNLADVTRVAWTTERGAFSLLLSHEPGQAKKNSAYPFALQLSGHTHGGQIAMPFAGSILKLGGLEIYKSGFYRVNDMEMYVSRGIGMSVIRARFLTPPEIVVMTLQCK